MKTNEEASPSQDSAPISRRDLFVTTAIATVGLAMGAPVSAASQNLPRGGTTSKLDLNQRRRLGSLEVSALGLGCMAGSAYFLPLPGRQRMISVIRDAVERGVTFGTTMRWPRSSA